MTDTPMIAAISLMRRRPDLTFEQFRDHWLHPHGTMTAELPGVRRSSSIIPSTPRAPMRSHTNSP